MQDSELNQCPQSLTHYRADQIFQNHLTEMMDRLRLKSMDGCLSFVKKLNG